MHSLQEIEPVCAQRMVVSVWLRPAVPQASTQPVAVTARGPVGTVCAVWPHQTATGTLSNKVGTLWSSSHYATQNR